MKHATFLLGFSRVEEPALRFAVPVLGQAGTVQLELLNPGDVFKLHFMIDSGIERDWTAIKRRELQRFVNIFAEKSLCFLVVMETLQQQPI